MAKSFYKLPEKRDQARDSGLVSEDVLVESDGGYLLKEDAETLETYTAPEFHSVYALHRNDPLYKAFEPALKSLAKSLTEGLPYDCDHCNIFSSTAYSTARASATSATVRTI